MQVDAAVAQGQADAAAAITSGPQLVKDTFEYFGLKKKRDPKVQGVSFEKFVSNKSASVFL